MLATEVKAKRHWGYRPWLISDLTLAGLLGLFLLTGTSLVYPALIVGGANMLLRGLVWTPTKSDPPRTWVLIGSELLLTASAVLVAMSQPPADFYVTVTALVCGGLAALVSLSTALVKLVLFITKY